MQMCHTKFGRAKRTIQTEPSKTGNNNPRKKRNTSIFTPAVSEVSSVVVEVTTAASCFDFAAANSAWSTHTNGDGRFRIGL